MLTENTTKKIAKQLILAEVSNYGKSVLTDTFLAELSSQKKNKQQKPHHSELTANFIHLLNNAKKKKTVTRSCPLYDCIQLSLLSLLILKSLEGLFVFEFK